MSLAVVGCLVLCLGSRLIFIFMKMKSESGSQSEGSVGVRHTPLIFQKPVERASGQEIMCGVSEFSS
ncbi:hypothetical protein P7D26_04635 [Lactococcus petauri]|uniref:hypothetical protein n=1 Tax=Lactococcus petauri TaxID=1940789 RepID=UPI00288C9DBF|nr:hypothetical protein [Lactococcus petauri]MDT2551924.1 hypothetical protein [Lactococcus petauri]MDT2562247.1 hypothetical protein [Lactococcus petauri]MDT2581371.1 hypothetical protein [Lactococcus petauri]